MKKSSGIDEGNNDDDDDDDMAFLAKQIELNKRTEPLLSKDPVIRIIAGQIIRSKARATERRTLYGKDREKAQEKLRQRIAGQVNQRAKQSKGKQGRNNKKKNRK